MSTNTYTDPVLTTELREWVQTDTFVYEGSIHDVGILEPSVWAGMHHTSEAKKRIAEYRTGKKHPPEVRQKLSDIGMGKNNSMYGKKRTDLKRNSKGQFIKT